MYFDSPAAFRRWLAEHHAQRDDLVVGFHKRATGRPTLTWSESVDEALCFGWIDGVRHRIDDDRYTIRFTPRKPTSIWSAINVAKIAALTKAGKVMPAGAKAFAARRTERTAIYSFERAQAATLAPADQRRFEANRAAWAYFSAQAPWYRRTAYHWVVSAKREETRAKRLDTLITDSAAGRPIKQLRRK